YADKGRDILLDSYSKDKFNLSSLTEYYLYILVDILLDYYILIRRGDQRIVEILDLFIFEFKGEGPIYYILLIFMI
ncbi:hypothetical protein CC78DRAFT_461067, partial [Lojkania enalia]